MEWKCLRSLLLRRHRTAPESTERNFERHGMAASLPWPLLQSRGITVIAIGETYRLVAASKLVVRVGARAAAHAAAFSLSAVSEATRHFGQGLVRATIEALDGGFKIVDANKQAIAYVYGHADSHDAGIAKALTLDEVRRIASNIAKLPTLLGKGG
jgi:hypothetical protein